MSDMCKHEWVQLHEEFIPHPFNLLYKCLQCQRVIIGEKKVLSAKEKIHSLLDKEMDVLYINFHNPPVEADDSFVKGDLIIRLLRGVPIGVTLLNFQKNHRLIMGE